MSQFRCSGSKAEYKTGAGRVRFLPAPVCVQKRIEKSTVCVQNTHEKCGGTAPVLMFESRDTHLHSSLWRCVLNHCLNIRLLEQHTAAVPFESGEADDFQFCVNLRAVIYNFQRFTEQRRALVDAQPLCVHIGENAAERVVDELLQRRFFDFQPVPRYRSGRSSPQRRAPR